MKIISVINYKGGVGKTTLTANIAAELAFRGYNVLMIDVDPQASLTFSFVEPEIWERDYSNTKTLKGWFDKIISEDEIMSLKNFIFEPEKVKKILQQGKLSLISSHLDLINADTELANNISGTEIQMPIKFLKAHEYIKKALRHLAKDNDYNFVFIDCPPNFNMITKNSLVASDYVLIPAKPDYLSTLGIDYLQSQMNKFVHKYNKYAVERNYVTIDPKFLGVVFNMVQFRSGKPISSSEEFIKKTRGLGFHVFANYIKENKRIFGTAGEACVPVVSTQGTDDLEKEIVRSLEKLTTEILNKIQS